MPERVKAALAIGGIAALRKRAGRGAFTACPDVKLSGLNNRVINRSRPIARKADRPQK